MTGRIRRLCLPALVALGIGAAVLGGASPSLGQAPAASLTGLPELEVINLLDDEKYVSARTKAEALLRADPDSIVGHFALGVSLREAEGALARAMSHLREARRLYEGKIGVGKGGSDLATLLHKQILVNLEHTAGLMEQYDYELTVLHDYDQAYEPHLIGQRAWPLMKLRRFDEARDAARRAIATGNAWQKNLGLNALCAIEAEAHERQASYEQCLAALDHAKKRAATAIAQGSKAVPHLAVHAHNAALGALSVLRLDEAERLALEGTHRMEATASNPWRLLVDLYLTEGRGGDAVAAIRQMLKWCAHQPPGSRDQKEAETAAQTAILLLAAGEATAGLRFISRALERPDRQGISSGQPEQALGGHALVRRALLRLDAELAAEKAAARGTVKRGGWMLSAVGSRASALPDDERVVNVLSDDERLDATLRVHIDGGLDDVPTWILGDLVPVLGPGVVAVALERVRRQETLGAVNPYFDALEAEVALARGEPTRAETLAKGAFEALPRAEALLRARASAIAGEAARRRGDGAAAAGHFQRALELDPGTIRRLGLAIPTRISVEAGIAAAARAGEILRRSPRFYAADGAFEVRIQAGDGGALRACLLAPFGASLGCADALRGEGDSPDDQAARLADELHRVAFALHLPITDTDLRSLDGATTIARDSGRERLRGLLGDTPEEGAD